MTQEKKSEEEIKEYIKKEIAKSGFPLEIKIATLLDQHAWAVLPHLIYPAEKDKNQELDIYATKDMKQIKDGTHVLVIECKKQENKPWIFFEQNKLNTDVFSLNISPLTLYGHLESSFMKNHYYCRQKPCAYHFPAFIKGDKPDVILDAINQVSNALLYCWGMEMSLFEKLMHKRISLLYPIIVLDGQLFSAKVGSEGEIDIKASEHLQLKVSRALEEPLKIRYIGEKSIVLSVKYFIIDIVQKSYFKTFLENFP